VEDLSRARDRIEESRSPIPAKEWKRRGPEAPLAVFPRVGLSFREEDRTVNLRFLLAPESRFVFTASPVIHG
jgi:hypothetical protein